MGQEILLWPSWKCYIYNICHTMNQNTVLKIGSSSVDRSVSEAAFPWTVLQESEPFVLKMRSWENLSSGNMSNDF